MVAAAVLSPGLAPAADLTGRFSMLGATARAHSGEVAAGQGTGDTLTADQQSLRLMGDGGVDQDEWSLHLATARVHANGLPVDAPGPGDLFRYRELSGEWLDEDDDPRNATRIGYELDRAFYRHRFDDAAVAFGRQPIDWGSGRFWQPLNVFGAFAPTAIDTDFKQGIDALVVDYYPSAFSSLAVAYVFAPREEPEIDDSAAVYYRRQVGESSELSLAGGRVLDDPLAGAAFETDWAGLGWRVEAAYFSLGDGDERAWYWIAGLDYQFPDATSVTVEWHDDGRGVSRESAMAGELDDPLVVHGLQQQLSRRVLALGAQRDLTPLWHGGYALLVGILRDGDGDPVASALHQVDLRYSVSNESDLLLSLVATDGKGVDAQGAPRSEFGHVPNSLTVRLRFYF